jgi:hypothetical protein
MQNALFVYILGCVSIVCLVCGFYYYLKMKDEKVSFPLAIASGASACAALVLSCSQKVEWRKKDWSEEE